MAALTAAGRKHIKSSSFALPGRRYPINDAAHARNALARVAQNGSPEEKARVRAAVGRRFPGIGKGKSKKSSQRPARRHGAGSGLINRAA